MTIYEILAGEGLAGAIALAVIGIIWAIIRPHLYNWLADKKLEKLLLAVETAVAAGKQKYTDDWKAASANGKLTAEQGAQIMTECRAYIIQFLKSQGVDALKEYGPSIIDSLCEAKLAELKESSLKKSALLPLESLVVKPENFSLPTN